MNERIKQLAEQAEKYASEKDGKYDGAGNLNWQWQDIKMEKFAELLIRQCMRMCDCADVSLLEHNRPQEASGAAGDKQFIKEWFEVEE
jgi:hypothetical protein